MIMHTYSTTTDYHHVCSVASRSRSRSMSMSMLVLVLVLVLVPMS